MQLLHLSSCSITYKIGRRVEAFDIFAIVIDGSLKSPEKQKVGKKQDSRYSSDKNAENPENGFTGNVTSEQHSGNYR